MADAVQTTPAGHTVPGSTLSRTMRTGGVHLMRYGLVLVVAWIESMEMLGVHHARSCSHCKAHDVDNLYVVDASFFPSSGAVNPALTVMANALRVGHHILERLA